MVHLIITILLARIDLSLGCHYAVPCYSKLSDFKCLLDVCAKI